MTEPNGILIVNKPSGMTSHDVVNKIRRIYGTKKVGHTGTLDPMATGVLVVLIGRATKACEYVIADKKTYECTLKLGVETDTEDVTGTILTTSNAIPDACTVNKIVSTFLGEQTQIPPMYSALKIGGQKLVDLARQGVTVERQGRKVTFFDIQSQPTDANDEYQLTVTCSGGTYIRTLCADIGKKLGCGGVMKTLNRTRVCDYAIENAFTLEALTEMSEEQKEAILLPIETFFDACPSVHPGDFYYTLLRNGCTVDATKLSISYPVETLVKIYDGKDRFTAVGKMVENEGALGLKMDKVFVI